jgi:hypothetical protein
MCFVVWMWLQDPFFIELKGVSEQVVRRIKEKEKDGRAVKKFISLPLTFFFFSQSFYFYFLIF